MEDYIHQQNLILFRKCLAEPNDEAKRMVLLKLLADEESKISSKLTSRPEAARYIEDLGV